SKPTNFSNEYLLLTLKTMFEKPDGQDAIWKSQRSVHGLALLILLVERRYPLSRFTLEQLVNVTRLQVEKESEMSLELLSRRSDVNDAMGLKKKTVVVTYDPLALIAKKTKVKKKLFLRILKETDKNEQVLLAEDQAWMESSSDSDQEINANMVFMAQIEKVLLDLEASSLSADDKISEDTLYNGRKGIGFENPRYFEKVKDLRPSIYDEKVIGLGYTLIFLTHSDKALEIEKFKRARQNKIEFAYDYGNLNASYVNEKIKFSDDYFQEIINPEKIIIDLEDKVVSLLEKEKANLETIESLKSKGFESSENAIFESENQSENDCHVVEKECDQVENSKVIAPGMFKLSVSQSVSPISMSKMSCDSKNVERIGFENPRYFKKAKDLRPTLYDEKVIGLGYTSMFLTYFDEALEIEKFKRSRENKIEFAYD
nr:hypothetical protein [Tanacetum cinerariifolium]